MLLRKLSNRNVKFPVLLNSSTKKFKKKEMERKGNEDNQLMRTFLGVLMKEFLEDRTTSWLKFTWVILLFPHGLPSTT